MRAICNTAKGKLESLVLPLPQPGPGQVRIRTAACGICATDFEMIDGSPRGKFPQILGHEWSGFVDKCGPGTDPNLQAHPCVAENVLADGGEIGFEHSGGYGEFFLTEASNIQLLPDDFPMEQAALIEPLAVCVRGLDRLIPEKGPSLIIGDGPIGLLMLMLMKAKGIQDITLVGGRKSRLQLAEELGASVVNYHDAKGSVSDEIASRSRRKFANFVEATKSTEILQMAITLGLPRARVLVLGNYEGKKPVAFDLQEFLLRELAVIGSNASAGAWPSAVSLAVRGAIPLGKLISHRYPAAHFEEALATARTDRNALKVAFLWNQSPKAEPRRKQGRPVAAGESLAEFAG
jgi:threonine dehydrogenase-like Zn-dependent dehydrogenase